MLNLSGNFYNREIHDSDIVYSVANFPLRLLLHIEINHTHPPSILIAICSSNSMHAHSTIKGKLNAGLFWVCTRPMLYKIGSFLRVLRHFVLNCESLYYNLANLVIHIKPTCTMQILFLILANRNSRIIVCCIFRLHSYESMKTMLTQGFTSKRDLVDLCNRLDEQQLSGDKFTISFWIARGH